MVNLNIDWRIMKNKGLVSTLWTIAFVLVSCVSYTPEKIAELARQHDSVNPILSDIERYADYYFKVPDSMEDLALFTKAFCEEFEPRDMGTDPAKHVSYIFKKRLKYASFVDSCFFYDPKLKVGCCFNELPQAILNQPWKVGLGHGELAHPVFYGSDGKAMLDLEDSTLEDNVLGKARKARYTMGITIQDEGITYTFPLRILCRASREEELTLFTEFLPEAEYALYDKVTKQELPCNKTDALLSESQKQEMWECLDSFFTETPSLSAIVFYSILYFNTSEDLPTGF